MAQTLPILEKLTAQDIRDLMGACVSFDAKNILGQGYEDAVSYSIPRLNLSWKNKEEFRKFITAETRAKSIVEANKILEARLEYAKGEEARTTPEKEKLEAAEKLRVEKREHQIRATEKAKAETRTAIEKQKEIYARQIQKAKEVEAALKNKKIYYKIENASEGPDEVKNLRAQAEADPKRFIDDAGSQLKNGVGLKNLSPKESSVISQQIAVSTYEKLADDSPVVLNQIINTPEILNRITQDAGHQEILKSLAGNVIEQRMAGLEFASQFINLSKIGGFEGGVPKISFSFTPQDDYKEFDIGDRLVLPGIENLNQQISFIDSISGFGEQEIRSQLFLSIGKGLEMYVSKLPADSFLAQTYNSEIVHAGLSYLGFTQAAPWVAAEGSLFGKFIVGSGFGEIGGLIQAKTGINLGLKLLAKTGAEAGIKAGAEIAVSATAETAVGVAGAGPTAGLSLLLVLAWEAVKKVGKKLWNWIKEKAPEVGKFLIVGLGALLGFGLGGITGGIVGGLGTFAGYSFFSGGVSGMGTSLAGLGSSILGFFGALGGATLRSIGKPLLATLLGFPVIVAFILLIINSGAYVVPLTPGTFGRVSSPYIEVIKTPDPPGPFSNNDLPKTITYKVTIRAKKEVLKNVVIKYDCLVISTSVQSCPATSDIPTFVDKISPSFPYTFTYSSTYDNKYRDSAIIDTIAAEADTIEQRGATSDGSASVTFGAPPISCPLPGGTPLNSMNYSYNSNNDSGHGSTSYWNAMGDPHYRYPLPQLSGCMSPSSCSYYGYALDVFPHGTTTVYAPTVLGKNVTWNLIGSFTNPSVGYSLEYSDPTGSYMMVLTHIFSPNGPTVVNSGEQITSLFNQGGNTHLHLEFQVNGRWVKPENYFCK